MLINSHLSKIQLVFGAIFTTICVVSSTGAHFLAAQEPHPPRANATKPIAIPDKRLGSSDQIAAQKQLVKVSLATSRPEVTRNHAWGLTADLTNVSSQPVTIFFNEVQLVMQPEATRNTQCTMAFNSFLPNTSKPPENSAQVNRGSDESVTLQPGEHYMFFWSGVDPGSGPGLANDCDLRWWGKIAETLNFIPGSYTFSVDGRVRLLDSKEPYHTFAESVNVRLGLEQLLILLCAGIGAILAYFVVALRDDGDVDKIRRASDSRAAATAVIVFLRNLGSAFLLGAVLTVVANRLSDSQFPVKVSVNDVWGALTVGFVFFFIGDKLIAKLKNLA